MTRLGTQSSSSLIVSSRSLPNSVAAYSPTRRVCAGQKRVALAE